MVVGCDGDVVGQQFVCGCWFVGIVGCEVFEQYVDVGCGVVVYCEWIEFVE